MPETPGSSVSQVSDKVSEQTRTFLLGLFMSLRTAQIHDTSNKAYQNALLGVHQAADTLFKATGGFRIQLVEDTVFVNGGRVRMDRSAFSAIRSLKAYLEEQQIGGIAMTAPPNFETVKELILHLSSKSEVRETSLGSGDLELLGVQQLADDDTKDFQVDRRILAIQSYGKLLLAARELLAHAERGGTDLPRSRIRAVRVIQDLVELADDRADFILRLSTNRLGVSGDELHGVNVGLLAIALGTALGLPRTDLVDLGITAMFHHVACRRNRHEGLIRLGHDTTLASLCHLMFQSGASDAAYRRAAILARHRLRTRSDEATRPNVLSRILGLATAYDQLTSGFGTRNETPAHPLDVLQTLHDDTSDRFDVDLVDLLVNMFRAFPIGCEVVLDDGRHAIVDSHLGSSRWDRPVVNVVGSKDRVDLMQRSSSRFRARIRATPRYLGRKLRTEADTSGGLTAPVAPEQNADDDTATRGSVDDVLRAFLAEDV